MLVLLITRLHFKLNIKQIFAQCVLCLPVLDTAISVFLHSKNMLLYQTPFFYLYLRRSPKVNFTYFFSIRGNKGIGVGSKKDVFKGICTKKGENGQVLRGNFQNWEVLRGWKILKHLDRKFWFCWRGRKRRRTGWEIFGKDLTCLEAWERLNRLFGLG